MVQRNLIAINLLFDSLAQGNTADCQNLQFEEVDISFKASIQASLTMSVDENVEYVGYPQRQSYFRGLNSKSVNVYNIREALTSLLWTCVFGK